MSSIFGCPRHRRQPQSRMQIQECLEAHQRKFLHLVFRAITFLQCHFHPWAEISFLESFGSLDYPVCRHLPHWINGLTPRGVLLIGCPRPRRQPPHLTATSIVTVPSKMKPHKLQAIRAARRVAACACTTHGCESPCAQDGVGILGCLVNSDSHLMTPQAPSRILRHS